MTHSIVVGKDSIMEMYLNNLTPLKFQMFQQYRFSDIQCS